MGGVLDLASVLRGGHANEAWFISRNYWWA